MSTATRERPALAQSNGRAGALAGTGTMLRFMLRRDRIRFPAWVLGLTLMTAYFANAIGTVMDHEALEGMVAFSNNPIMGLIGGPGYGFDDITVPRFLAGMYAAYLMLGAALMGITTISRHTRVEEQTGRAELIRANVVGRHSQLAAALIIAVVMSVLSSVFMGLAVYGSVIDPQPDANGSFLFGFSVGAIGLVFAGVAAVTMQLSAFSRAASGIAGAVLGVTFVVRGLGDMAAVTDGDLDWLSWLSPLGWAQQTAPFTLDRWWPLTLCVGLTAVLVVAGFALQSRRDLNAGMLADRLGSAVAPGWLRSPLTLAFRLQRASLIGWSVAMLLAGVVFGAFVEPMRDAADDMPEEITGLMGGADEIVEGYVGFMGIYMAIMISVFAILSVQSLRGEESGFRTEPVLAASVSRTGWLLSWTVVTAVGVLWLLFLAGLGTGVAAGAAVGDWDLFGPVLLGHVVHAAPVWMLLAVAVAMYGLMPRLVGFPWLVLVYSMVVTMFGPMLELEQGVQNTSVFDHVGQHPAEDIGWAAVGILTVIAVAGIAIGVAAFRRRDLVTA